MTLFKMNRQLPTLPFAHPETSKTTLWMGDLDKHWDEQYVQQIWFGLGEKVLVKIIRDKSRDVNYAFVDFGNPAKAAFALQTYNGALIPNHQQKRFKLNWATGGGLFDRKEDKQPEYSIFVGDLSPDWTDSMLLSVFANRYPSCKSARIMTNSETGLSRGYGFVRFTDPADQQRALAEMNGATFGPLNRPMRVCLATPKHRPSSSATNTTTSPTAKSPTLQQDDPHNTTVFVGGLSTPITEQELREYFRPFGEILYTKIPPGKGCGFVQFVSRRSAELAIQQMNGFAIGNSRIRLSWGRSQNDKSAAAAAANAAAALAAMTKQNQLLQPLSSSCRPYYDPITDLSTTDTPFQSFGQQLESDILPRRRPSFLGSFSSSPPNSRPIDWDAFNTRLLDLTKSDSTSNATNSTTPSSTWSLNHIYAQ